ncbi:MAG: putative metalloprotease CJM1_0395 family protein [Candidatus Muiribacteriota bacterium]
MHLSSISSNPSVNFNYDNNSIQKSENNTSNKNSNLFEDTVEISEEAKRLSRIEKDKEVDKTQNNEELTEEEKKQLEKLKQTDREVRQHEATHLAAAGGLQLSGANFEYKTGPDGQNYAVGGDVHIDSSEGKNPEDTISKAQQIKRAALAPANPSPEDLKVAREAQQMEAKALAELNSKENEEDEEQIGAEKSRER